MTKNDYIEKITQNLEHLTKEQLIQITQMYMDDVDCLKNEVNRLNDLLFKHENNYKKSTFWLRDGSYLRLKTLEVGYTLPKSIVNKIKFNNIRVFFIGTNLLTFAKFKEWDPELGSSTGAEYPLSRVMTLGLTVNI